MTVRWLKSCGLFTASNGGELKEAYEHCSRNASELVRSSKTKLFRFFAWNLMVCANFSRQSDISVTHCKAQSVVSSHFRQIVRLKAFHSPPSHFHSTHHAELSHLPDSPLSHLSIVAVLDNVPRVLCRCFPFH